MTSDGDMINRQVLLIEDDAWLAEMYLDSLQLLRGVSARWARDAEAAFDMIAAIAPDLILLDMFLPGHNGIEFLHEVASYSDINKIPIMILSAVNEHEFGMTKQSWLQYGVVGYLYKPRLKPQILSAAIQKQLLAMQGDM